MKRNLLRLGLLSLLLVFAFIAKAQNVTAVWDFQNNLPEGINTAANFQGKEGDLASTVEGITMHVNATQGKLKGRTTDAQFNAGTILQIPVKSANDVVTVTTHPTYHNLTVGGKAATENVTEYNATSAEVAKGYVEVVATGSSVSSAYAAERKRTSMTVQMLPGSATRPASSSTTVPSAGASMRWLHSTTTTISPCSGVPLPKVSPIRVTLREHMVTEASGAVS